MGENKLTFLLFKTREGIFKDKIGTYWPALDEVYETYILISDSASISLNIKDYDYQDPRQRKERKQREGKGKES